MRRVVLVGRDRRFSPNMVEKDRGILDAVGNRLRDQGCDVGFVDENDLRADDRADIFLSMARGERALDVLDGLERRGSVVMNRAESVRWVLNRWRLDELMRRHGIPTAPCHDISVRPTDDGDGFWVKSVDGASTTARDVMYARRWDDVMRIVSKGNGQRMVADGTPTGTVAQDSCRKVMVYSHIVGDLVKFYGVQGCRFFRYYYPTDDGDTKFGCERVNGDAHHFAFNELRLQEACARMAAITGLRVYGGDCIVRSDGTFAIIDFNDWPSFSRCREDAADAIAAEALVVHS